MARRVSEWQGMVLQTGRRYELVYGRQGLTGSVLPFAVPSQEDFARVLSESPGVVLESVIRSAFSDRIVADVVYDGANGRTPSEVLPAELQVEADVAGSVVVGIEEIVVHGRVTETESERARDREGEVVTSPSGELDVLGAVPWAVVLPLVLLAFAFTGAGQQLLEAVIPGE